MQGCRAGRQLPQVPWWRGIPTDVTQLVTPGLGGQGVSGGVWGELWSPAGTATLALLTKQANGLVCRLFCVLTQVSLFQKHH